MKITLFALFLTLLSAGSMAQVGGEKQQDSAWGLGASALNMWISSEAAQREGLGESSFGSRIFGNYNHDIWLVSFGLDLFFLDDDRGFEQFTENEFTGEVETSSSSSNATGFFAAAGPQWRMGAKQNIRLYAQAGLSHILSAERSIARCSNCREEDIELDAGAFVNGGVDFVLADGHHLGLQLQQYISSDDLERVVAVNYLYRF